MENQYPNVQKFMKQIADGFVARFFENTLNALENFDESADGETDAAKEP